MGQELKISPPCRSCRYTAIKTSRVWALPPQPPVSLTTPMPAHKKRKLSGLTGIELVAAIQALTTLKNSLIYEEVTPGPRDVDAGEAQLGESLQEERVDIFDERLEGMIRLMQSKLEEPLVRSTYITFFACLIFYSRLPSPA